jgi:subtilisin family serine protease
MDKVLEFIGANEFWRAGFRGANVSIGIIDTGIDDTHPDLFEKIIAEKDFTGLGNNDAFGHGTCMAGLCAGSGNASLGRFSGVAPEANICSAKALNEKGFGDISAIKEAVEWLVHLDVDVILMSFGISGPCDGRDKLSKLCDKASSAGPLIVVPAALGASIGSPDASRSVLTVGASSLDDEVAWFSARGPTLDGRLKPDIVAPGCEVTSCRARGTYIRQAVGDYYATTTGISTSAGIATGAAALIAGALKETNVSKPKKLSRILKRAIMESAVDIDPNCYRQGAGRLDLREISMLLDHWFQP